MPNSNVKPNYALWNLTEKDFPNNKLTEQLKFICAYGHLAASSHNTQPWIFLISSNTIEVHADMNHQLKIADPTNKELYISVGCTIPNIEIAASHLGFMTTTTILPNKANPDHIATITFTPTKQTKSHPFFPYLTKRLTNRSFYKKSKPLPSRTIAEYKRALKPYQIDLETYQGQKLEKLAQITKDSMYVALSNPAFREELSHWVRHSWTKKGDGLPANTLGVPDAASIMITTLVKSPLMAKTTSVLEARMVKSSSAIGIIYAKDESIQSWIHAGMAYSVISLITHIHKMSTSPLSGAIEIKKQREELLQFLNEDRHPMMFFRIGYPTKKFPHSPRRNLDEVVRIK